MRAHPVTIQSHWEDGQKFYGDILIFGLKSNACDLQEMCIDRHHTIAIYLKIPQKQAIGLQEKTAKNNKVLMSYDLTRS